MDKFAFLHDEERVNENLGISDRRHVEIVKQCEIALIEGDGSIPKALEWAMNKLEPKNLVEAMYIGFVMKARIDFKNPLTRLGMLIEMAAANDKKEE